jgi:hypothetical protein
MLHSVKVSQTEIFAVTVCEDRMVLLCKINVNFLLYNISVSKPTNINMEL